MKGPFLSYLVTILLFTSAFAAEFQVNTRTTYDQTYADIAADANGNFIAVWRCYRHPNDGDSGGIFARQFASDATPTGGEFHINTTTTGNQTEPSVAMNEAGNFVVAWQSGDTGSEDIYAQRFDTNANPIGIEFLVNADDPNGPPKSGYGRHRWIRHCLGKQ